MKTTLLIINGVSFALVFLSGFLFSGQALAPIKKVINQVDEIGVNNLNQRVDEGNGTDEIARLAKTFNKMLDRIEKAFKIQKDFIANASHELRTPLTAIIGQLEVNLMKERTVQEYRESYQSALDEMKNLNLIANRLLLLAQTSSGNEKMNFSDVRIDEVMWQVKSELQKRNPEYKIHIELSEDLADDKMLTVSGSEELLKTAFINLADNGCKYSGNHEVWINLYLNMSRNVMIQFKDKGIGIPSEDIEKIFEPFHRSKNVINYKGHGIGLSLVKRIINLHNGKINLESSVGKGTVIKITLPNVA